MIEIPVLLILLALPVGVHYGWWVFVCFLLVLPGVYALMTGVQYFPTFGKIMRKMLALAAIQKGETVYDLGSGDGRFVFAAARKGATAIGYELSLPLFLYTKIVSLFIPRSHIYFRNFWKQDYRDADVIFCFLLISLMQRFEKEVWPTLKPGTRVISHSFKMKGIKPVKEDGEAVLYIKD